MERNEPSPNVANGSLFKLIIINFIIFIFLIILVEIAVRIFYPNITLLNNSKNLFQANRFGNSIGLTPNIEGYSFEAKVITDKNGFRIAPSLVKSSAKHTILVLGDSISFGPGVKAEDSFPFILQKRLKDCKIINASVIGYNADDYFNVLNFEIKAGLHFDGVIDCICLNDFSKFSQRLIRNELNKKSFETRYPNGFLRLLRYITDNFINFNQMLKSHSKAYLLIKSLATDTEKNYFEADLLKYDAPNINEVINDKLKRIYDLAAENGKWLVFVVAPYEYQLRPKSFNDPHNFKPQKLISDIALKQKWPIIDLWPIFKRYLEQTGKKSTSLYISGDPMHFSVTGHRVAAQGILAKMDKQPALFNLN